MLHAKTVQTVQFVDEKEVPPNSESDNYPKNLGFYTSIYGKN
jgi:hypothetical protein